VVSSATGVVARWVVPFLTVVGVTVAATSTQTGIAPPIRLVDSGNPIAGHNLYVDPTSAAVAAAHRADPPSAELDAIANTPQAFWIDNAVPSAAIGRYVNGANAAGAMPVLAVYALPHRDCGSFAAGGFGSGDAYRQWIDGVASTVGGTPSTFIVEPDALDMADCLSGGQREERYSLIRYAVDAFTRNPAAAVYIDGGHSRWLSAAEIANRLNQVGINHARGSASTPRTSSAPTRKPATAKTSRGAPEVRTTSSTPRVTVSGPRPMRRSTGATPAVGHSARRPRRRPRVVMPTLTSGSSVPATRTDRADAANRARVTS
jgi:cellulase/cellobiase CelA1